MLEVFGWISSRTSTLRNEQGFAYAQLVTALFLQPVHRLAHLVRSLAFQLPSISAFHQFRTMRALWLAYGRRHVGLFLHIAPKTKAVRYLALPLKCYQSYHVDRIQMEAGFGNSAIARNRRMPTTSFELMPAG